MPLADQAEASNQPQSAILLGILALQGDYEAHARTLERLGLRPESAAPAAAPGGWRFVRHAEDLDGLDGLILPGGESTTMLKFLEQAGFLERLRQFAAARPCFGTCAGAILMARQVSHPQQPSLGVLELTVERNAYGRQIDSFIDRGEWAGAQEKDAPPPEMVFIRAPRFRDAGPTVEVLARWHGEPVLVRQGKLLAATFHPELTEDTRVHEMFLRMIRSARAQPGESSPRA